MAEEASAYSPTTISNIWHCLRPFKIYFVENDSKELSLSIPGKEF